MGQKIPLGCFYLRDVYEKLQDILTAEDAIMKDFLLVGNPGEVLIVGEVPVVVAEVPVVPGEVDLWLTEFNETAAHACMEYSAWVFAHGHLHAPAAGSVAG